jgi:hypothetical protein
MTCAAIASVGDPVASVQPVGGGYVAIVRGAEFAAYLDPNCSWWNPETDFPAKYVLQHEQIHFAFFEIEARRLNASQSQLDTRLRTQGATPEEATKSARREFDKLIREAHARVVARSNRFDSEVSMTMDPERQQEWADRVEAELGGR